MPPPSPPGLPVKPAVLPLIVLSLIVSVASSLLIAPPVPAFYAKPGSIGEMVDHTVGRMLDLFDIDVGTVRRWGEDSDLRARPDKA